MYDPIQAQPFPISMDRRETGHIDAAATAARGPDVTLATTSISDGDVLPFSEVACDEDAHVVPATLGDRQKVWANFSDV
jgi:hypothetical protein